MNILKTEKILFIIIIVIIIITGMSCNCG